MWGAWNNRGQACFGLGRYEQALADYTRAIEINPDFAEAYRSRAVANYFLRRYDAAWADVRACRSRGGSLPEDFIRALSAASGRGE